MTQPTRGPKASNALTYLLVVLFSIGTLGFLFLLFGELFVVATAVFAVVGLVGLFHYFTWGRAMLEQGKKPPKPDTE